MNKGAILLAEWIKRREYKTQAEAASVLELTEGHLSMLLSGDRLPGRDTGLHLEDMTGIPMRAWTVSAVDESRTLVAAAAGKRKATRR